MALEVDPALVATLTGESGSNANGSWVRLENGLQVCWNRSALQVSNQAIGSVFRAANADTWTFPVVFTSTPVVVAVPSFGTTGDPIAFRLGAPSLTNVTYRLMSANSPADARAELVAVGRWK